MTLTRFFSCCSQATISDLKPDVASAWRRLTDSLGQSFSQRLPFPPLLPTGRARRETASVCEPVTGQDRGTELLQGVLDLALERGHAGIAKALIDQGAEPSPAQLRLAAERGHGSVVRLLLDEQVDPNNGGRLPPALMAAARAGYVDVTRMLLEHVPDRAALLYEAALLGEFDQALRTLAAAGASVGRAMHLAGTRDQWRVRARLQKLEGDRSPG